MKSKQPVSDKDLDKVFHDKLYSLEVEPSEALWSGIADQLTTKKKKSTFPVLWIAAASLTAMIGVGVWFSSQKEPMKLTGTAGPKIGAPKPESLEVPIRKETIIVENQISRVTSVKVSEGRVKNASSQPRHNIKVARNAPERTLSMAQTNVSENTTPVRTDMEQSQKESIMVANQSQTLALATDIGKERGVELQPAELQRKQRMIKSVGSLVNFVVSKVDKRKDKIIEFEDNDEGTKVSGLNLGLVKYQAKE